jgi:hypothetical protein
LEERPLLDGVLRLVEALVTSDDRDGGSGGGRGSSGSGGGGGGRDGEDLSGRRELSVALLGLLAAWLHGCPMAVASLLNDPENLFLVEVAATTPPKAAAAAAARGAVVAGGSLLAAKKSSAAAASSSSAASPASPRAERVVFGAEALRGAVHGLATLVLGVRRAPQHTTGTIPSQDHRRDMVF